MAKTARCVEYLMNDLSSAEAERLAATSDKFAEAVHTTLWKRSVPNAALRHTLQSIAVSPFVAARDMALIPPWLVKEGRSIVVYDANHHQITQTVGVADEAAPTLSVLLGRELDRPSTSIDGGFRRQIDDAVGSHRPVTVLAVDPSVGVRLWWHRDNPTVDAT